MSNKQQLLKDFVSQQIQNSKQQTKPIVNSDGFKNGEPPAGSNWRIPGDTLYNPTPYPIQAVSDNGITKTLNPFDESTVEFPGAKYVDEYQMKFGGLPKYQGETGPSQVIEDTTPRPTLNIQAERPGLWTQFKQSYFSPQNWGRDDLSDNYPEGHPMSNYMNVLLDQRSKGNTMFMWKNKKHSTEMPWLTRKEQLEQTGITDAQLYARSPFEEMVHENIDPFSYENKGLRAMLGFLGVKEQRRKDRDNAPENIQNKPFMGARTDAFNLSMGKPQRRDTFSLSEYRPSKAGESGWDSNINNMDYFAINKLKDPKIQKELIDVYFNRLDSIDNLSKKYSLTPELINKLKENKLEISLDSTPSKEILESYLNDYGVKPSGNFDKDLATYNELAQLNGYLQEYDPKTKNVIYTDNKAGVMGNFTLGQGVDENGKKYVSYYDKWDIETPGGMIPFGKPYHIYDRMYYQDAGLVATSPYERIPKSWKEKYDWTPNVEEEYIRFKNDPNAPDNLRFTDDLNDYNVRGMWDSLERPVSWEQALTLYKDLNGEEWVPEEDGYYHAWSQHPGTGEWLKPKHHSTAWMNFAGYPMDPYSKVVVNSEGFFGDETLQTEYKKDGGLTKYQKGRQVVYTDPEKFKIANQAYRDSSDVYDLSQKVRVNPRNLPEIDKNTFNALNEKNRNLDPKIWAFDKVQYEEDKKKNNIKDFKDYMYEYPNFNNYQSLETYKKHGENLRKISPQYAKNNPIKKETPDKIVKLKNGIERIYPTYEGEIIDEGLYTDVYPNGTSRTYFNNELEGIDAPNIKPIGHKYYGKDEPEVYNKFNLSSDSTGWYNSGEKPKFKNISNESYEDYQIPTDVSAVYKKPETKPVFKKETQPVLEELTYIKPKPLTKLPVSEPTLVSYDLPAIKENQTTPIMQASYAHRNGQYQIGENVWNEDKKKWERRMFKDEEADWYRNNGRIKRDGGLTKYQVAGRTFEELMMEGLRPQSAASDNTYYTNARIEEAKRDSAKGVTPQQKQKAAVAKKKIVAEEKRQQLVNDLSNQGTISPATEGTERLKNQFIYAMDQPLDAVGSLMQRGYVPQGNLNGDYETASPMSSVIGAFNPASVVMDIGRIGRDAFEKETYTTWGGAGEGLMNAAGFLPFGNFLQKGKKLTGLTQIPISNDIVPLVNTTPTSWSMQHLPGLHLKSTMSGSPLEKQLSKTGEINRNNIIAHINKAETSAADKFTLQKVLDTKFPNQNKIDYNDFRKAVSDEAIELERKVLPDYQYNNWGVGRLGYPFAKRSSFDAAIKSGQENIQNLERKLSGTIESNAWETSEEIRKNLEWQLSEAKNQLAKNLSEYEKAPLENLSITYENPTKFGSGSGDHFDESTLGHARTLVSQEEPDIMHFLEQQSDYWQKLGKTKPVNLEKYEQQVAKLEASYLEDLETLKKLKETKMDYAGNPKSDFEIAQFEDIINKKGARLNMKKGDVFNPQQKEFLGKNYQERLLQENVKYAAEQGKSTVRFPTSETAAKIQGYNPVETKLKKGDVVKLPNGETGILNNDVLWDDFISVRIDGKAKQIPTEEFLKHNPKYSTPSYEPTHQTILKKYTEQPKMIKKLFGAEPRVVTDVKGNKWYEFDIPESFKQGKAEIKAYKQGGLAKFVNGGPKEKGWREYKTATGQSFYLDPRFKDQRYYVDEKGNTFQPSQNSMIFDVASNTWESPTLESTLEVRPRYRYEKRPGSLGSMETVRIDLDNGSQQTVSPDVMATKREMDAFANSFNPAGLALQGVSNIAQGNIAEGALQTALSIPVVGQVLGKAVTAPLKFAGKEIAQTYGPILPEMGRYLTTQTPLKNAYKINPWAFKVNENNWYRQVGQSAIEDALKTKMIREAGEEVSPRMYQEFQDQLLRMQGTGPEAMIASRRPMSPFFAKGELFYPMGRKPVFTKSGKLSKNPAGKGDAEYLIETALPNESFQPAYVKGMGLGTPSQIGETAILKPNPTLRELENFQLYKQDWLKGYKKIWNNPTTDIDFSKLHVYNKTLPDGRIVRMLGNTSGKPIGQDISSGGAFNDGVYTLTNFPDYVIKAENAELMEAMIPGYKGFNISEMQSGLSSPNISKVIKSHPSNDISYQLMRRISGTPTPDVDPKTLMNISDDAYRQLWKDAKHVRDNNLAIDFAGDNIMYDNATGTFKLLDISPTIEGSEWNSITGGGLEPGMSKGLSAQFLQDALAEKLRLSYARSLKSNGSSPGIRSVLNDEFEKQTVPRIKKIFTDEGPYKEGGSVLKSFIMSQLQTNR